MIKNLDGALEKLPQGIGDYFMWEKYTTKPFVDRGIFRRIGECPTPWPCFVIAEREQTLADNPEDVTAILDVINRTTREFKQIPSIDVMISNRYGQQLEDVRMWLSQTRWSQQQLSGDQVTAVMKKLEQLELIDQRIPLEEILYVF